MRRLSDKLSFVILVLLFGALVITPNTQAQSINRSPQGYDNAVYKAFADTLTTEQFKSIEQILQKYKTELNTFVVESGQPNAAAVSSVFLPLVQGGNSSQRSEPAAPTLKRDLAVEKLAKRFAEVQGQINGEIRSILTSEQASMFDEMFGSLSLPVESAAVQSANTEINTTYCYYAYYHSYYAEYYSYYSFYYAYYAWYYSNSTYAYYAYYYSYYAYYYAYPGYYYGYYCYYG